MKIERIAAYKVDLPLHEGSYKWSGGKSVDVFDSTIVRSRNGQRHLAATAKSAPWDRFICPPMPTGVRAGITGTRAASAGQRPQATRCPLNRRMDAALKGHPYVKSGIDMACWDILGQARRFDNRSANCSAAAMATTLSLYRAISQESPEEMAAKVARYRDEGYRRFQLKVGADPRTEDIERIRQVSQPAGAQRQTHRRCQYRLAHARGSPSRTSRQ